MTIELNALRGLWVIEEAAGSYAVDQSSTLPTGWLAMPYKEGTLTAARLVKMLDPMPAKVRADGHAKKVLGPKGSKVGFSTVLHSHGSSLHGVAAAPTAATWALMRVLKALMGATSARVTGGATTVQAGTTSTVVNVTAGRGADFTAGQAIACQFVSGSSIVEAREILSIATDAITVKEAFSAVPVTGTNVAGSVTFYLTEDPDTSLQMICEGRESDDRFCYRGLQGGFKIALKIGPDGDLPELAFDLMGATYAALSSASPQTPTYGVFSPFASTYAELTVPTVGSTTRAKVEQSAVSFEPNVDSKPVRSGGGIETVSRMRRQATRPFVKGSFTIPFEDLTWENARANRTDLAVFQQIGNIAGSCCLISCPTVQVTDVQPAGSDEGISGQTVSFEGRHDESALGGSTALSYSAMRIHLL